MQNKAGVDLHQELICLFTNTQWFKLFPNKLKLFYPVRMKDLADFFFIII